MSNPIRFLSKLLSDTLPEEKLSTEGITRHSAAQLIERQLTMTMGTTLVMIPIFITAHFLGSTFPTMAVLAGFVPYRISFGGVHLRSKLACFAVSMVTFTALGYVAMQLGSNPSYTGYAAVMAVAFAWVSIHKRGVIDTSEVYITRPELREQRHMAFVKKGKLRFGVVLAGIVLAQTTGLYMVTAGLATGLAVAAAMLWLSNGKEPRCRNEVDVGSGERNC